MFSRLGSSVRRVCRPILGLKGGREYEVAVGVDSVVWGAERPGNDGMKPANRTTRESRSAGNASFSIRLLLIIPIVFISLNAQARDYEMAIQVAGTEEAPVFGVFVVKRVIWKNLKLKAAPECDSQAPHVIGGNTLNN